MANPIIVYKNLGETPLEALSRLRKDKPELADKPLTYAGRLDPMAEGLLLVLSGDDCLKKEEYLSLTKEYEMEILFGFETDTYDLLGKIKVPQKEKNQPALPSLRGLRHGSDFSLFASPNPFEDFTGEIEQEYPPYSSKPVNGKPLFQIARDGKIGETKIPTHKVRIDKIKILEEREISKKDLEKYINEKVSLVKGDFRQEEILKTWNRELGKTNKDSFQIVKVCVSCGSGAYMRVLAYDIGKKLGVCALAFSIKRTKIGEYKI